MLGVFEISHHHFTRDSKGDESSSIQQAVITVYSCKCVAINICTHNCSGHGNDPRVSLPYDHAATGPGCDPSILKDEQK